MKTVAILKLALETEQNVVDARQRARQIAAAIGLENQDQIRLATAVSELARNAFQYAHSGRVEFSVKIEDKPQQLVVTVTDRGNGIKDLQSILGGTYVSPTGMGVGLLGAKKLCDHFEIKSDANGTCVSIAKNADPRKPITPAAIARLGELLHRERPASAFDEMQRQNFELAQALTDLQERQSDLALLNEELNETNRGVVALYAELDERASSLHKANEVKTNFLSNMTHEFRTPLTSIISLTRLLTERIDGDLTPEQERQVMYIRKSAEGLLELVNDLLDLAKVEAGRITLKIDDAEARDVMATLRGVFRPILAPDSPVELDVEMPNGIPTIHSDEGKISQILRNLVSNALKFTERGSVYVTASLTDDDYVLFSVRDTGIGIAADDIEKIFEDFSQIESSLQNKSRGTGLGLPLSRKLARLLGGDLWVESQVGKGSTFYVKVPRIYRGDVEGQIVHQSTPILAPAHAPVFVIVDDDETSRYVLKNLLRTMVTAKMIECDSPTVAHEVIAQSKPDLVFLDLAMPGRSGFEILRGLKSDAQTAEIPICINTAKILTPDETDFLGQLCVGILSKERSNAARANKELHDVLERAHVLKHSHQEARA